MARNLFSNTFLLDLPDCMGLSEKGKCIWLNITDCKGEECKFKRSVAEQQCMQIKKIHRLASLSDSQQTHNCTNLIKVIKTVYTKKVITAGQGKNLGQIDKSFMKKAEDLLYGEFAVVLGIPKENVKSYIEDRVKELNSKLTINS